MRSSTTAATALGVLLAAGAPVAAEEGWLKDPVTGCEIWSAEAAEGQGATWTGACLEGKISGLGVLTFWDAKGFLARYTGEVVAGRAEGEGSVRLRNDEHGGFDRYMGVFEAGEPKGEGFLVTAQGHRFFGELIEGMTHARGTLRLADGGGVLRGEFKDGAGVGPVLVYHEPAEGEVFFGNVEEGARQGFGIHAMADGTIYRGDFAKGEPAGPGLIETEDGRQYMGMFAAGLPDGPGTGMDAEGNVLQGMFKAGKPDGMMLVTKADGSQSFETWQDGEKVE